MRIIRGVHTGIAAALLFFVLSNVSRAQAPVELALEDALRIGLENNRLIKISLAKNDAADAKAQEAAAAMLPSLTLTASYQRLSDVDPFQITVPFSPNPITVAPTVLNNYNARLAVQQPLFTGFKLSSNARAADLLAQASSFETENDKADLTLNITSAYWALYQVGQTHRFMEENVARLEMMEADTKNLLRTGMATRNDLLKVQLQLNNARLSRIDARNDMRLAMMSLNTIIGQPVETEIRLVSLPVPPADPEGKPVQRGEQESGDEAYMQRALALRPDVLALRSRVEASHDLLRAAEGNWWPQVILSAGYTYARPNQRYQPTRDEFKATWDVGVQLQFTVWNWMATARQTEQASAALRQSELALQQLHDNIRLEVQRQLLALDRAREKVSVALLSIEQAEENQRITNDKYKQGLATSTELLDANVALLQANTGYSAALVEHEIAKARWKRAIYQSAVASSK